MNGRFAPIAIRVLPVQRALLSSCPPSIALNTLWMFSLPSMHQDNCGYLCMIIQPAMKEDAGWYTVSAKNEAGIVSSTARLDVHSEFECLKHTHTHTDKRTLRMAELPPLLHPPAQWQQPNLPKPRKVRPSTSRYAALTERGLDVKAAFFPDSSPVLQPGGLVESDDL